MYLDTADNFPASNPDANKCTADDGGEKGALDDDDMIKTPGSLCDAEQEIEAAVVLADGFEDGCTVEHTVMISCTWDSSGEMGVGREADPSDTIADGIDRFLKCTAK